MSTLASMVFILAMICQVGSYDITRSEPVLAPRGPVGNWPDSGCFAWEFQIDMDGVPYNLRVKSDTNDYGFHVAMRSALRKFRFQVEGGSDPSQVHVIRFKYRNGEQAATVVPCCNCNDEPPR